MPKTIDESMEDLLQDIARWRLEMERLRTEGHGSVAAQFEKLVADAEKVVSRWKQSN